MDDIEQYLKPSQRVRSSSIGWKQARPVDSGGGIGVPTVERVVHSLALNGIVETQEEVREGNVVVALVPAWDAVIRLLKSDSQALCQLPAEKWEELVAASYEQAGFDEVILTPRSGDLGRDVIATKRGYWSVRIIDQVKAYKPDHLVTANDVRALVGVLYADQNASKGVVTTTSDFAPKLKDDPLLKPLMPYRLELVNGTSLFERLREAQ